ncbi:unnamed protein product, partial [Coccothraustes coccothraustes]
PGGRGGAGPRRRGRHGGAGPRPPAGRPPRPASSPGKTRPATRVPGLRPGKGEQSPGQAGAGPPTAGLRGRRGDRRRRASLEAGDRPRQGRAPHR